MNGKDLTNFVSYLVSENDYDSSHFDVLEFMDFENINPLVSLELAWMVSLFVDDIEGNEIKNLTTMQDSFLYVFSKINWYQKNGYHNVNDYIDVVFKYLKHTRPNDIINEQFMFTKIVDDHVLIDSINYEWADESCVKEHPDEFPPIINRFMYNREMARELNQFTGA